MNHQQGTLHLKYLRLGLLEEREVWVITKAFSLGRHITKKPETPEKFV